MGTGDNVARVGRLMYCYIRTLLGRGVGWLIIIRQLPRP
jgi:hypothetical protein